MMTLDQSNRVNNAKLFLDEKYNEYVKLVENSNLIHSKKVVDVLTPIQKEYLSFTPSNASTSLKEDFGVSLVELKDA
jgi:hypothetical protein